MLNKEKSDSILTKNFKIEGMSCGHCVMAVKKSLSKLDLKEVHVLIGSAEVEYDKSLINEAAIKFAIEDAGYRVVN
jgi:copper chaperone